VKKWASQKSTRSPRSKPRGEFNIPDLPENFMYREKPFKKLKKMLLDGSGGALAITAKKKNKKSVLGMGGVGKTVATSNLCKDEDVIKHFRDGE